MRLGDYLAEEAVPPKVFAAVIGAPERTLYAWQKGERIPKPEQMRLIFVATGGAVAPNDFYDLPDLGALGAEAGR